MSEKIRYYALVTGFMMGQLLFKALALIVGGLLMSMAGLLIVQQYWLAMVVGTCAACAYEGGHWLFVARWARRAE